MPVNFAAYPPENANTTEPRVLRASNGPDRRNRINTERRLFARAREGLGLLSVTGFPVSLYPRLAGFAAAD
jgi:uncharacterized membrane protein YidH (DUF202 family)